MNIAGRALGAVGAVGGEFEAAADFGVERVGVGALAVHRELHFHAAAGTQHRDPGTPVVQQKVFEFAEVAGEHWQVDVRPVEPLGALLRGR